MASFEDWLWGELAGEYALAAPHSSALSASHASALPVPNASTLPVPNAAAAAHAPNVSTAVGARRRGARRLPALLAGTLVGLGAFALALVLAAGSGAPAFAVTRNADGSVTVTLEELSAAHAANAQLAKLGVPVEIAPVEAGCQEQGTRAQASESLYRQIVRIEPYSSQERDLSLTIDPAAIPAGDTLVLAAALSPEGNSAALLDPTNGKMIAVGHFALYEGTPPGCQAPVQ